MEKGTIIHQGKYAELIAKGVDFAGAVDVSKHEKKAEEVEEAEAADIAADTPTAPDKKKADEPSKEQKAAMRKSGKKRKYTSSQYIVISNDETTREMLYWSLCRNLISDFDSAFMDVWWIFKLFFSNFRRRERRR